jgi:hypothetical protein
VVQKWSRIVLRGIAISYYAKQLAQHLVLSAVENAALVNQIEVRYPTDEGTE